MADDWYTDCLTEFRQNETSNYHLWKKLRELTTELGLPAYTTLLSLGSGDAVTEMEVFKDALSGVRHMIAVDIDKPGMERLRESLTESYPHVTLDTHCSKVERFPGPDRQVDLIHMLHMIYYIEDPSCHLKRFYEWLKPGGRMLIQMMAKDNIINAFRAEYQELCPSCYFPSHARHDILAAGIPDSCVSEYHIPGEFTVTNVKKVMANFFYCKQATVEETGIWENYMESLYPDGEQGNSDCTLIVITKPQIG